MEIEKSFRNISQNEILTFEKNIGFQLPKEYTDFLIKNNGGVPSKTVFKFKDFDGNNRNSLINLFFPLGKDLYENIELNYEYFVIKEEERVPLGFLIIGDDPFGNLICLSLNKADYGFVYFWDHELEGEEGNLSVISNNFVSFLNSLKEEVDFDE